MKEETSLENFKRKIALMTLSDLHLLKVYKGGIYRNLAYDDMVCEEAMVELDKQIDLRVKQLFEV